MRSYYRHARSAALLELSIVAAVTIKLPSTKSTNSLDSVVTDYHSLQMLFIHADLLIVVPQHDTSVFSRMSMMCTLFTEFKPLHTHKVAR